MPSLQADAFRWMQDSGGTWLCARAVYPAQAKAACEPAEPGKAYELEIKERRKKRSLDANAYFWTLAGKLAAKLRITPEEVYRSYVRDIGGNFEVVPVREGRVEAWDALWCKGHVGRLTEDLGPCKKAGYRNIRTYFGSSDYDTRQMSRLIDLIVADCKAQGVETLTPRELDALKEGWK